jgi:hypothetical protein
MPSRALIASALSNETQKKTIFFWPRKDLL